MRKIISTVFVSLFFVSMFALEPFHIDINTEFGATKGTIKEYVVSVPTDDVQYVESRLDWDVKYIMFMGASVDVVLFEHFYLGLAGRFGVPSVSGNMQDYDWLNVDPYEFRGKSKDWYDEHYWLTNYSKHDNELTRYLDGSVKIGGIIKLPYQIFLLPSVSFQGQEFAFDGFNGYCQYVSDTPNPRNADGSYKKWDKEIPKTDLADTGFLPDDGNVISYYQQRMFLFVGLKAYTTIVPRFCFAIEGNFSPFTMIGAVDNHCIRNIDFLDRPKGFGTWNVSGKIQFSFDKWRKFALTCDYHCVPFLTGPNYSKSSSSDYFTTDDIETEYLGGVSSRLFSFSFAATLSF